jgi:hypothetical protein
VREIGNGVTAVHADVAKLDDLDRLPARIKENRGGSTSCSPTPASAATGRVAMSQSIGV